jgi:hypothetical protein
MGRLRARAGVGFLVAVMLTVTAGPGPGGVLWAPPAPAWAEQGGPAYTPPPGSAERRDILEALRRQLQDLHGLELVFEVRHLKVKGDWAWLEADPRSPDGAGRYEPVYALLRRQHGRWQVAELPSTEEESPFWQPGYLKTLRARFPGLPLEIFPARMRR